MLVYGKCECFVMLCVHAVAVLNAALCMTCSLLMVVGDVRGDHIEEALLQSRSHNCIVYSHECLLLFTTSCCSECLYHL